MSNVGEEDLVVDKQKQYELLQEQEEEELLALINSPGGRWFIWRILEQCEIFSHTSSFDPHRMMAAAGKRDIGLWLIKQINSVDSSGYMKLVNESKKREIK